MQIKLSSLSSWSSILCICLALIVALISSLALAPVKAKTQISGWTTINYDKWPVLEKNSYFIASNGIHHFIKIRNLNKLKYFAQGADIEVELHYFYEFAKVRPIVQFVSCSENVDIVNEQKDSPNFKAKGLWHKFRYVVRRRNCMNRNELDFNVILHDEGDVFAWKSLKITRFVDPTATTNTTEITPPAEPGTKPPIPEVAPPAGPVTKPPSPEITPQVEPETKPSSPKVIPYVKPETKPPNDPKTNTPEPEAPDVQTTTEVPKPKSPATGSPLETSSQKTPEEIPKSTELEPANPSSTTEDSGEGTSSDRPKTQREELPDLNEDYPDAKPWDDRQKPVEISTKDPTNDSDSRDETQPAYLPKRKKRSLEDINQPTFCIPSSCDRRLFELSRFQPVLGGIPRLVNADKAKLFKMVTNNEPLRMKISSDEDLSQMDTCLNMKLFMDRGTELEIALEGLQGRVLENLAKESNASFVFFDNINRCISDYMPALNKTDDNTLKLKFTPKIPIGTGRRIFALMDPKNAAYQKEPHRLLQYIPNVLDLKRPVDLQKYWTIDSDGVTIPRLNFETFVPEESTSNFVPIRQLKISNINPKQKRFDLTSRWIKPDDTSLLEYPVYFVYNAKKADWLDYVEFEFERANGFKKSKKIYQSKPETGPQGGAVTQAPATSQTSTVLPTFGPETTPAPADQAASPREEELRFPIRLKSITNEPFRIRLKHYLKNSSLGEVRSYDLDIRKLAFGDACAWETFCNNNGKCKPTGLAQAKCLCEPGFSGNHCEKKNSCDMMYGSQTGRQVCSSLGAECFDGLPEIRCLWKDDKYFDCKPRFDLSTIGSRPSPSSSGDDKCPANGGDQTGLVESAREQRKLIIILAVFMVALILFATVIIINMTTRLIKSKRRLRRAQTDVIELKKRSQASSSTAGSLGRLNGGVMNQSIPTATMYTNQAFDVE